MAYQQGAWYNGRQYWNGQFYDQPVTGANGLLAQGKIANTNAPDQPNYNVQASPTSPSNPSTPNATTPAPSTASFDPIAAAGSLQSFYKTQNQPAITTLQSQYNPDTGTGALADRYSKLLESIKSTGSVAVNAQTQALNAGFAARGLAPSEYTQTQLAQGLLPVTAQIENTQAQAGLAAQQDFGNIAAQIAGLQAGNPSAAITGASSLLANLYPQIAAGGALYNVSNGSVISAPGFQISNPIANTSTGTGPAYTPSADWINSVNTIDWGNSSAGVGGINATPVPASFWALNSLLPLNLASSGTNSSSAQLNL